MPRQGQEAFVGELALFAAATADPEVTAIARRAAAPLRVEVRGRRGVGCSTVARALNVGPNIASDADTAPEVVVYVFAEVVKPEDVEAVRAARCPVLGVLNKVDVTGFAGDGPSSSARGRCEHFSALLGVSVQPMIGLLGDVSSDTLGPLGAAVAVAAARRGNTPAQVQAMLRRLSGVDAVLDQIAAAGAEARYRRVCDAVAELEALAVSEPVVEPEIARFLARDDTLIARMAAALDLVESAGPCHKAAGATGYLTRAARWQRYSRAHAGPVQRACGADIVRGSLRLWSRAGGEAGEAKG